MKITRYKRVQRYLAFYRNNFGFRPPFQLLLDGTFCQSALKNKVNIKEQMSKYLNGDAKLMTTVCVVNETEKIGAALYGAMIIVKQFTVRKCGHEKDPISASECLYSMIKSNNNSDHYLLATQDRALSHRIRQIPGAPLLYMKMNAIVMEKPTQLSTECADDAKQIDLPEHQINVIKELKRKELGEDCDQMNVMRKKKKGPKGPNPLSCKKKTKKRVKTHDHGGKDLHKNKRKRNKMPKHIKRMFKKIESSNLE